MQPTIMNANRPPYARFEMREVEDREKSLENKFYTTKDIAYALITPSGSRDVVEKIATEWFEQLEQFVREERFPPEWLRYYREQFRNWLEGQEPALEGTDIRNWPVASPSQQNQMRQIGIRTVEDLAEANEEALNRLGMGGRMLKEQAVAWVKNASSAVVQADNALKKAQEELAASNARIAALEERMKLMAPQPQPQPQPDSPTPAAKKL